MQKETIIGYTAHAHRVYHLTITITFLICWSVIAYLLFSFIPAQTGFSFGWLDAVPLALIALAYFIILAILSKKRRRTVIIDDNKLTYVCRTILLTAPTQEEPVLLWKIASIYRDDDYLYLYDKRHDVLLRISSKTINIKEIADELKKRLPNIEYSQYSKLANSTSTYQMSRISIIICVLLLVSAGVTIWQNREILDEILYSGFVLVICLWYLIYRSTQKVVIDKEHLTYKSRTFFFTLVEKTIKVSDIASMGGNKSDIWLFDKNENKLIDLPKNIFYLGKLTHALEIIISNRESDSELPIAHEM